MSGSGRETVHTCASAAQAGARHLRLSGIENAPRESELLLAHVVGVSRTWLRGHPDEALTPDQWAAFWNLVRRRGEREPLPYLLGTWEFLGLTLKVTPAVLIPRPETEHLVEALAPRLRAGDRVLDVGTGSGCIALGLRSLVPGLEVVALEVSAAALDVARENAAALGMTAAIQFIHGAFPEAAREAPPFAAIAANPPYIPTAELARLQPEVRDHEPRLALDGGPDGLNVLRSLAREGARMLQPGGWLATEVAQEQAEAVADLLHDAGHWTGIEIRPDLAGIPRVVLAERR